MLEKEWLVEIRVKDWVHVPEGQSRIVTYVEVLAPDEYLARHAGFECFANRCKYEPVTRRLMTRRGLEVGNCCAPDAVTI